MKKLVLIDGSNLIFRAYYATESVEMTNGYGVPVNAVKTILSMLDKILKSENPDYVYIAMDNGKATFRHKMYENYKGTRPAAPEKLKVQFPLIIELFTAMGINCGASDEFEADDLIASYATIAENEDLFVKVITGDKDLLQLVDKNVNVLTPKIGFSKEVNYDPKTFIEKYTFLPEKIIDYKALVGDSSDNIIGVSKLGDKTAKKLLAQYNGVVEVIEAAKNGEIKGKLGENIVANEENILNNVELVTLIRDADLELELDNLKFTGYDYQQYGEFLREQGFIKEYNNLIDAGVFDQKLNKDENFLSFDDIKFTTIDNFSEEYVDGVAYVYTQSLKPNYYLSENLGVAIVSDKGNYFLPADKIDKNFNAFLEGDHPKVIYNVKRLMVMLKHTSIGNLIMDPYLAVSLLDSSNFTKDFPSIFNEYGVHYVKPIENVYGRKQNPKIVNYEDMQRDLVGKAMAQRDSLEAIKEKIIDNRLENVLDNIETPLSQVLARMELNGITVDKEQLLETKEIFLQEDEKYLDELKKYTDININSSSQLSELLFEQWNLPKQGLKKTRTGISTDVDNLEKLIVKLKDKDEVDNNKGYQKEISFLEIVLKYRKNSKILNTYLKNLQKFITSDNKIHPINNQLLSETGRLSVMDPNIQNMPISGEYSQYIRSLFIPVNGAKIIAFDYSQIELRVMAVFSGDQNMLEAFKNDRDIHTETAKAIFGLDSVTPEERSRAKAINFGIIYGMSSYGLAKQVGISNDEAKSFIQRYFESFPGIAQYMHNVVEEAQGTGYVKTFSGRMRKIPTINSKNFREKEQAKRMAINTPIQGTAADILKMALIAIQDKLKAGLYKSRMIMQIHDEIVFEVVSEEQDEIINMVTETMENIVDFPIKLKVDHGIGENWLETK